MRIFMTRLPANRRPHLLLKWIIDHANQGDVGRGMSVETAPPRFAPGPFLERDRNTRVRDAVRKIHGAINRIHHPAIFRILVAGIALLAEERNLRESGVQFSFNQLLAAHIEFELDVVRGDFIRLFLGGKVFAHDCAGGSRRVNGGGQGFCWREMFHQNL
jgi:hypothetical protein